MALKMQKGHQKFQISNYKVDKSWGGNAKSMVITVNKAVFLYLQVAESGSPKFLSQENKFCDYVC